LVYFIVLWPTTCPRNRYPFAIKKPPILVSYPPPLSFNTWICFVPLFSHVFSLTIETKWIPVLSLLITRQITSWIRDFIMHLKIGWTIKVNNDCSTFLIFCNIVTRLFRSVGYFSRIGKCYFKVWPSYLVVLLTNSLVGILLLV